MASMNYVQHQLEQMGLTVAVDGDFILAEDPDLDFERSHDGVTGISRWLAETRGEYEVILEELLEGASAEFMDTTSIIGDYADTLLEEGVAKAEVQEMADAMMAIALEEEHLANETAGPAEPLLGPYGDEFEVADEEDTMTDKQIEKDEAEEFAPAPPIKERRIDQLALAKEINMGMKEIAQAAEIDDQDRGGIANHEAYITQMKQEVAMSEVVHTEKVEFRVTGMGYVKGPFERKFDLESQAKQFARACVALAKSPKYAATIKVVPWTIRS